MVWYRLIDSSPISSQQPLHPFTVSRVLFMPSHEAHFILSASCLFFHVFPFSFVFSRSLLRPLWRLSVNPKRNGPLMSSAQIYTRRRIWQISFAAPSMYSVLIYTRAQNVRAKSLLLCANQPCALFVCECILCHCCACCGCGCCFLCIPSLLDVNSVNVLITKSKLVQLMNLWQSLFNVLSVATDGGVNTLCSL